jgi:hypothetical protein
MTKASVHDIHYLQDLKHQLSDCNVLGDKGYLSGEVQPDLFEKAGGNAVLPVGRSVYVVEKLCQRCNGYFHSRIG